MRVTITVDDILVGSPYSRYCPMNRAIRRECPEANISVTGSVVIIDDAIFPLNHDLGHWVDTYDWLSRYQEPDSLEVDLEILITHSPMTLDFDFVTRTITY